MLKALGFGPPGFYNRRSTTRGGMRISIWALRGSIDAGLRFRVLGSRV